MSNRKPHSQETKDKISATKKLQHIKPVNGFKKGYTPYNKGGKSPHVSERNKIMNRERSRENHWNWKGGISKIDRIIRRTKEYLSWRKEIFIRDNFTCRTCNKSNIYITAHHIKSFSSILKLYNIKSVKDSLKCEELWDINNGITLCEDCHSLTDNYKGRGHNK